MHPALRSLDPQQLASFNMMDPQLQHHHVESSPLTGNSIIPSDYLLKHWASLAASGALSHTTPGDPFLPPLPRHLQLIPGQDSGIWGTGGTSNATTSSSVSTSQLANSVAQATFLPLTSSAQASGHYLYQNLFPMNMMRPLDPAHLAHLQGVFPLLAAHGAGGPTTTPLQFPITSANGFGVGGPGGVTSERWWETSQHQQQQLKLNGNPTGVSNASAAHTVTPTNKMTSSELVLPPTRSPATANNNASKRSHASLAGSVTATGGVMTGKDERKEGFEHSPAKRKRKQRQKNVKEISTVTSNGTIRTLLQTADAEDHFKKSLRGSCMKNTKSSDRISPRTGGGNDSKQDTSETGVVLESVDAHFEKSLAGFHHQSPISSASSNGNTVAEFVSMTSLINSAAGVAASMETDGSQRSCSASFSTDEETPEFSQLYSSDRPEYLHSTSTPLLLHHGGRLSSSSSSNHHHGSHHARRHRISHSSSTSCSPESHLGDDEAAAGRLETSSSLDDNSSSCDALIARGSGGFERRSRGGFKPKQAWLRQYDDRSPPTLEKVITASV